MLQNKEEIANILDKDQADFYLSQAVGDQATKFLMELLGIDEQMKELNDVSDTEIKDVTKQIFSMDMEENGDD